MNEVDFEREHFAKKAKRYLRAIEWNPSARGFEILPFALLIEAMVKAKGRQLVVADMLCGSGYLSNNLSVNISHLYAVDLSVEMMQPIKENDDVEKIVAGLGVDNHNDYSFLKNADLLISLAGLHHVYVMDGNHVQQIQSDNLHSDIFEKWMYNLPEGSLLIFADVPRAGLLSTAGDLSFTDDLLINFVRPEHKGSINGYLDSMMGQDSPFRNISGQCSLRNYIDTMNKLFDKTKIGEQRSPDEWFTKVVHEKGIFGHQHCFINAIHTVDRLINDGFRVSAIEIPTPWVFRNKDDAIYYFYEKFAFGQSASSPGDINKSKKEEIWADIIKHLGVVELDRGAFAVCWRLVYIIVQKNKGV